MNRMYNRNDHPKHPIRNILYAIACFFFSLSFCYLWICENIWLDNRDTLIAIAALLLVTALICVLVSVAKNVKTKGAHGFFCRRKSIKFK